MSDGIGNRREQGSRPIWLVSEAGLEAWQSQLPETAANWVRAAAFKGEAQRLLLIPGADGAVAGAALGTGPASGAEPRSPWTLARLPEALPPGHWHLATPPEGTAAT
ncbi:MAG TPA: hypothetical protein VLA38_04665, partial [Steroidobacteraceae bacterium]|nr:hypothetical protein [Steroidobacteraceae bacterium]